MESSPLIFTILYLSCLGLSLVALIDRNASQSPAFFPQLILKSASWSGVPPRRFNSTPSTSLPRLGTILTIPANAPGPHRTEPGPRITSIRSIGPKESSSSKGLTVFVLSDVKGTES